MLTLKELASASEDRRRRVLQARVEVLAENHALLRRLEGSGDGNRTSEGKVMLLAGQRRMKAAG